MEKFCAVSFGALLAILILILFLKDLRPTMVVAFSIPISLVTAIVCMYFSGVTLNISQQRIRNLPCGISRLFLDRKHNARAAVYIGVHFVGIVRIKDICHAQFGADAEGGTTVCGILYAYKASLEGVSAQVEELKASIAVTIMVSICPAAPCAIAAALSSCASAAVIC